MAAKTAVSTIKTFEDACLVLSLDARAIVEKYPTDVLAFKKLTVITEALNDGWKPNWEDGNEKYYPWFWYNSGSGFSFDDVGYYYQYSSLGSRLCFRSRELAEYAGRQFEALYNEYFSN